MPQLHPNNRQGNLVLPSYSHIRVSSIVEPSIVLEVPSLGLEPSHCPGCPPIPLAISFRSLWSSPLLDPLPALPHLTPMLENGHIFLGSSCSLVHIQHNLGLIKTIRWLGIVQSSPS